MMRVLVRKEFLALRRDARLLLLLAMFGLLFAAVLLQSRAALTEAAQRKHAAQAQTRHQWDHQGDRHPHRGAHFGLYVFAPTSALASFDPGVTRWLGEALWLEPHRRNTMRFAEADSDVVSLRLGELSAASLFANIMPLLVFALAFNAITQEREGGTLRMAFGAGIRPRTLVASKLVAQVGAPALACIGAVLALYLLSASGGDAEILQRCLGLLATLLAYCVILAAIGLTVSALARTGQQALAVLLLVWIVFTLIVPRTAAALAEAALPLPSSSQFWEAIKHDYENGLPGDGTLAERGARFDARLLSRYGVTRLEDVPAGAYALRRLERDAYADRVHAIHFERLWARYREQEHILRLAGLLSPTVALRLATMKFTGTDLAHRRHFEESAERYRQYVNTAIDRWDIVNSRGLRSFEDKYAGNAVWQSIRGFDYRPPGAAFAFGAARGDLALLAGWVLAAMLLLGACARKVRP